MKKYNINWKQVLVFYLVAVGVSAIFRLNLFGLETNITWPLGLNIYLFILKGIGPITGFMVIRYLLNNKVETGINTFWGTDKTRSLVSIAVIPVMMTILGVSNSKGLNIHYYGLIYSTMYVIYAMFEEYGWRGYLQNALLPLPELARILLIAVLWFAWHLNFITSDMIFSQHLWHFAFLVLGSWGLIKITEKTHSLLFATAVHLSFNLLTDVNGEFQKRMIVIAVAVIVWFMAWSKTGKRKEPEGV